ncbi:MAG: protealysin inhibitor emfourin [Nostocoides sp.]
MNTCQIVPPYILEALARSDDPTVAARARESLTHGKELRAGRRGMPAAPTTKPTPRAKPGRPDAPARTVGDAHDKQATPGTTVRTEGGPPTGDPAADEAYDGLGDTWTFYSAVFQRNSVDGKSLPLIATVHYGKGYDNAFWNGQQMVFGDGDGVVFGRFTSSIDVIGHELTHGVTQYTAGLNYQGQSGALNESVSDVFGSLVKQYHLGQSASAADWLIGADLLAPGVKGRALRDMLHPGTAYDDPQLGKDPQPADMSCYVDTSDDNGGVHLNSGIPNRAFALAATALGGNAWETVGPIWYAVLTGAEIRADCDFATFAGLTVSASQATGVEPAVTAAVQQAWVTVGVLSASTPASPSSAGGRGKKKSGKPTAPSTPAAPSTVVLTRSGGFAGTTKQAQVSLTDLPDEDTSAWETLLASSTLQRLAGERSHPDAYTYSVRCADLDVTVSEPHLPPDIHSLFERTLHAG